MPITSAQHFPLHPHLNDQESFTNQITTAQAPPSTRIPSAHARIGQNGTINLPERIYKLQPDRTLSLRGFDSFAAAASIHSASPHGFTVSGTFRDPADFAVAV